MNFNSASDVTLDGSESYDADGDVLTYQWELVEKPEGSTSVISSGTTVSPTLRTDVDGLYRVKLTVNDGKIDSVPDIVLITQNHPLPLNKPPVAVIEGPTNVIVKVGTSINILLDGTKSHDDGQISPLTYKWTSGHYIVTTPKIHAKAGCNFDYSSCYHSICNHTIALTVNDGEYSDTANFALSIDYSICNVATIHLDPAYQQTIPVTKHKTYKLWVYNKDGSTVDVTTKAKLSTSDPSIATIDASGKVTGISKGDVLIIGEYAGQKDTAPLTVTD